jgi:hypothetical protein
VRHKLLWNRFRASFPIDRSGKLPRLTLPESWKTGVKIAKWTVTIASLLIAFVTIDSKLVGFAVSVAFWFVATVIERSLFYYTSLVVHPLPNFEIDTAKWQGAIFYFHRRVTAKSFCPAIAFVFTDEEYARNMYDWLLQWTDGRTRNIGDYLVLSVVILSNNSYILYCYPNYENPKVRAFHNHVEQSKKKSAPNDVHVKQFAMVHIGRTCIINQESGTAEFFKKYNESMPVILEFLMRKGQGVRQINGLDWITLNSLKFRTKEELTPQDLEYALIESLGTYEDVTLDNLAVSSSPQAT